VVCYIGSSIHKKAHVAIMAEEALQAKLRELEHEFEVCNS